MARHVLKGELATTLWNQPYNGALDAYLLAPGLALAPHHFVYPDVRAPVRPAARSAVRPAGAAARGPARGVGGGALAAVGTPYMGLMTATGPPPNFLMPLVTGFPLLLGLRALDPREGRHGAGAAPALRRRRPRAGSRSGTRRSRFPAFVGMAAGLGRGRPASARVRSRFLRGRAGPRAGPLPWRGSSGPREPRSQPRPARSPPYGRAGSG